MIVRRLKVFVEIGVIRVRFLKTLISRIVTNSDHLKIRVNWCNSCQVFETLISRISKNA